MPRLVSLLTGSGMAGPGCLRNCAPTGALVTARNHFRFSSFSRQTASSMSCEPATAPTASKLARTPAVCKPCSGRPSLLGSTTQRRFMALTNIPVLATSYCPARLQRIGASQASASTTCCSRRLHADLRLYLALNKSSAITSAFNPPAAALVHTRTLPTCSQDQTRQPIKQASARVVEMLAVWTGRQPTSPARLPQPAVEEGQPALAERPVAATVAQAGAVPHAPTHRRDRLCLGADPNPIPRETYRVLPAM